MRTLCLLTIALTLSAGVGEAPTLARILDREGRLREIRGVAGAFVPGTAGEPLLAFSDDGRYQWRLAPGRLICSAADGERELPTDAEDALFRGDTARLLPSRELVRCDAFHLRQATDFDESRIGSRQVAWSDGMLRVSEAGAAEEATEAAIVFSPPPQRMTAAGPDWMHVETDHGAYLVRLTSGRIAAYRLPEETRQ